MSKFGLELEGSADEDFFGTLARTNLNQLFGVESNNENQTLKYQPVKQSEREAPAKAASAWQTHMVKVATAYKTGQAIGKVGVALLNKGADAWQMILYKSKSQVISTVSLLPQPEVAVTLHMQNRYLQYYDDASACWSLLFDRPDDERELVEKLRAIGVEIHQKQQRQHEPPAHKDRDEKSSAMNSILESSSDDGKPKHSKIALISRMAKMGQQLPRYGSAENPTEYSDSSDTEVLTTPGVQNKPIVVPRCQRNYSPQSHTTQIVPVTPAATANSSTVSLYNGPVVESQFMQMLLTENRTQNTELRMNMNKLEGKLEKVLDKIDCLHSGSGQQTKHKEDEILELEEKLLELKKENRKLKQSLDQQQRSHADDEVDLQTRILRAHRDEFEAIGLSPVNATTNLSTLIDDLVARILTLQTSIRGSEDKVNAIERRLQQSEMHLQEETERHAKTKQETEALQVQLDKIQMALREKEQYNAVMQETLAKEQHRASEQLRAERSQATSTVKTIMNGLYANVAAKLIALNGEPNRDAVLAMLGRTIREETLKAIAD